MLIIWSLVMLTILGVAFALGLSLASKKFKVDADPRIDEIGDLLPGANCGGCGFAGCLAAAEAVVKSDAPVNVCPALDKTLAKRVADIMGVEYVEREREIAVVRCKGKNVAQRFQYFGIADCRAAQLVQGGNLACTYGCLGFGSCADACPFDAIRMGPDRLPIVNPEKCTACGKCVETCPRDLICVLPVKTFVHVLCSSHVKGALVKKICAQGCIACKKCEKACPVDAIHVIDFLAEIDYEKCTLCGKCIEVCPTRVIEDLRKKKKKTAAPDAEKDKEDASKEEVPVST
ncbi:MAG: RnfABCDGE type electron transport complex subunit B [Planctomycetes bacterium]|nr:RnfABCDGE type electron transport complex subunit B [Planctomycetota bacterium]